MYERIAQLVDSDCGRMPCVDDEPWIERPGACYRFGRALCHFVRSGRGLNLIEGQSVGIENPRVTRKSRL